MNEKLWQVHAPHFCAGLVTRGDVVVHGAPILRWTTGRSTESLRPMFRQKRWRTVLVRETPVEREESR